MRSLFHAVSYAMVVMVAAQGLAAWGADAEIDALNLESAPEAPPKTTRNTRLYIEGALGDASQRDRPHSRDTGRASLDFSHASQPTPGLRAVISDRLDHIYPREAGADKTVNSLREAYLSWQPGGGDTILELGRVNLRYGPGFGYNPTDFFRDGSLRTFTTADPIALRENRMGSAMLRAQRLWNGGSLSVAFSPKLENRPDPDGLSLDLGSTNNRDRALVALGTQFSQRVSSQVLLYKEDGLSPTVGANMTALLSDAAVAHLEWTRGREPDLLSRALATPATAVRRSRFVGGATYTTGGKLSVTAEYQYNGFGLKESDRPALAASPASQLAFLREALRRQELAPRQAYLIYVTQKSLGLKDLDLTAFVRFNPGDESRLAWLELRHHWPSVDLAFQIQQNMGRRGSEFGVVPDRRIGQILGTYYF